MASGVPTVRLLLLLLQLPVLLLLLLLGQPSETLGFVVLEAMASGVPTV